ncbi:MAG: hypothetical protein JW782_03190 [Candidatus Saganbacteria bacterium]|nr:hypothetical protein [Candidatus Saganbacteria bacterium]
MRPIIICYSRTGRNKKLAQQLQQILRCDMEELIDRTDRSGWWNYLLAGRDSMFKKMTTIEPEIKNLESFDIIIISTPLWVGTIPPAIRTFLRRDKQKIKRLAVISVSMNGSQQRAIHDIENEYGNKPVAALFLSEKELKSGRHKTRFDDFVETLQALQKVKGDLQR